MQFCLSDQCNRMKLKRFVVINKSVEVDTTYEVGCVVTEALSEGVTSFAIGNDARVC